MSDDDITRSDVVQSMSGDGSVESSDRAPAGRRSFVARAAAAVAGVVGIGAGFSGSGAAGHDCYCSSCENCPSPESEPCYETYCHSSETGEYVLAQGCREKSSSPCPDIGD